MRLREGGGALWGLVGHQWWRPVGFSSDLWGSVTSCGALWRPVGLAEAAEGARRSSEELGVARRSQEGLAGDQEVSGGVQRSCGVQRCT